MKVTEKDRIAATERERRRVVEKKHYIWACQSCGPSETSRGDWCDRGCGSDYSSMVQLSRYMLGNVESAAYRRGLEDAAKLVRGAEALMAERAKHETSDAVIIISTGFSEVLGTIAAAILKLGEE